MKIHTWQTKTISFTDKEIYRAKRKVARLKEHGWEGETWDSSGDENTVQLIKDKASVTTKPEVRMRFWHDKQKQRSAP